MVFSRSSGRRAQLAAAALATTVLTVGSVSATPAVANPPRSGDSVATADSAGATPIYLDTSYSFAERAADLVSHMTLEEKARQIATNSAPAIPRLGVQQYTYWSEGQHGINRLGANNNHGSVGGGVHATSFPTNFAASMSWDPSLVYQETTAISDEARGFLDKSLFGTGQNNIGPSKSDYGDLTYWAPTVNLDRDPRWGRNDEAFGEDPTLVAKMAGAFVNGYQGQTPTGQPMTPYLKVAATAKHFALNDSENGRESTSSDTTIANIRNYYTAQFRSLIENSHVAGLMTSYNSINGTPAPANTYTANELAQRTWGFSGYSTSDCGAVGDIYSSNRHNWAPPGWTTATSNGVTTWTQNNTSQTVSGPAGAQAYALRAGTDLNCTGNEATPANIEEAIKAGVLSEGVLDNALTRVFTVRMETGEFDPPANVSYTSITKDQIQSPAHQALAEKVAANSVVLLKNDPAATTNTPLLPARPATLHKVVIVGNLANTVTLGGYSGDPGLRVSAVQGITDAVKAANPDATVSFDACGTSTTSTTPATCSATTLADMHDADLIVVVAGTDAAVAGEGHDRASLAMPGNYTSLIDTVHSIGNPRTMLAIQANGPVALGTIRDDFPAILFSSYNGESQGSALADVIFGKQNPSGHLTFTWYQDDSQLPDLHNYGLTPAETGGLGRTYQYFTGTPTYPFGYGLSYTTFRYSQIKASPDATTPDHRITVHFDVTNTGSTSGATVAQVYAATPFSVPGMTLPAKRLVGFQKTAVLAPGETQSIAVPVNVNDLAFFDTSQQKQVVYNGTYQFQVGSDSAAIEGTAPVAITGAIAPRVSYVTVQPDHVVYTPGQTLDLTGRNPWITDDTTQADQHVRADHIVEAVNTDESFVDLSHAHVTYASSNPNVATVNASGLVTTVAAGVATISATVNGVTGSTPVVVQQPLSVQAPAVVPAGSSFTATVTLPNPSSSPLTNVTLSLDVPNGWTAQSTSDSAIASVPPGSSARATWTVTAPDSGNAELQAHATFTSANGPGTATAITTVSVPYASLAAAFNNAGISDDSATSLGNLDGGGYSYSAQALAAASPSLTPGATITHDGMTFTWPAAPSGTPDDVVASGQTITLNGSGNTLGILGAGTYGTASGTATVTYTDGTTQSFPLSFADWYNNSPVPGTDTLTKTAYYNNSGGRSNHAVSVYCATVPLASGKTVKYLTLPDVSATAVSGQVSMHVFAAAIG